MIWYGPYVYLVDKYPLGTVAARILTHFYFFSFIATVGLVALYMWYTAVVRILFTMNSLLFV